MYKGNTNAVVSAKCPYFHSEFTTSITCEGVTDESRSTQKFNTEEEKDRYIRQFCCRYPNGCILADGLDKKYEVK